MTVVGRGVAGSAIARAAREAGWRVRVIDKSPTPDASACALALLRDTWADPVAVAYAIESYREAGCEVIEGIQRPMPNGGWATRAGWAVEVRPYFVPADLTARAPLGLADPGATVTVQAVGPGLIGEQSYGYTWVHPDPSALTFEGCRSVGQWATFLAGVRYRSGARFGSGSADTIAKANEIAVEQFKRAKELGWLARIDGWRMIGGIRVKREPYWRDEGGGLFSFGGFHRSGFALAPLAARDAIETLA